MKDQAHPVATEAWLSDAGTRWVTRQDSGVARNVWAALRVTGGKGRMFWEYVLLAPSEVGLMLLEADKVRLEALVRRVKDQQ